MVEDAFPQLVPLWPTRGAFRFGPSISCSKINDSIHKGSGSYSSDPERESSFGFLTLSSAFHTGLQQIFNAICDVIFELVFDL